MNEEEKPPTLCVVIALSCVSMQRPEASAVPFRYAAAATAMDVEVQIHAVTGSIEFLRRGVAENLFPEGPDAPSLLAHIQQAAALGVKIFACPVAMRQYGVGAEDLIDEVAEIRGAASMMSAGLQPGARFLTF